MVLPRRGDPQLRIDADDGSVVRWSTLLQAFRARPVEAIPVACLDRGRLGERYCNGATCALEKSRSRFSTKRSGNAKASLSETLQDQLGASPEDRDMSIKYYTHFMLRAPASDLTEFRGVVELNRTCAHGDCKEATSALAKHLACQSKDIQVLHWSRLQ